MSGFELDFSEVTDWINTALGAYNTFVERYQAGDDLETAFNSALTSAGEVANDLVLIAMSPLFFLVGFIGLLLYILFIRVAYFWPYNRSDEPTWLNSILGTDFTYDDHDDKWFRRTFKGVKRGLQ